MAVKALPEKTAVSEKVLVQDMAEQVAPHGFKVATHTVKEDHEREETTLTVKFVKANPDQGVLKLSKNGAGDEDDG